MVTVSTSKLACQGGNPVRDLQRKPWPTWPLISDAEWREKMGPALRAVYESRVEGTGGSRQAQFAERFAAFCKVKHCCLLSHGTDALAAAPALTLPQASSLSRNCSRPMADGGTVLSPRTSRYVHRFTRL